MNRHLVVVLALGACGKSKEDITPVAGSDRSAPAPKGPAGSAVAVAPADATSADAAAPAPSSKIAAARCGEPCLFLLDTPIDKLADAYQAACATPMKDLGFTDCKQLDYVRSCIYAAHGLVYTKKKLQQRFAAKPWYEPHPEANAKTMLSTLEIANVHELHERSKACKKSIAISGADYERLQRWLAGLAKKKPELPKLVFFNEEPATPLDFTNGLTTELETGGFAPKLEGNAVARYIDKLDGKAESAELPTPLLESLRAMTPAPRVIKISFSKTIEAIENPIEEGAFVFLAYDAKDQLVAVAAKHFLYD